MPVEIDLLKEVCKRLDISKISYMLTGSFAANFYATPRMTRDIDIVIEIQLNDAERVFQIFQKDFYVDRGLINEAIKQKDMFNIIHYELAFKIDFIIRKNDEYRKVEFQRRKQIQLDDVTIWIVTPEDLIISKLYWAKDSFSEMQIKDVKNLLTSIKQLDAEYIEDWVQRLTLSSIYNKANE